MKMAKTEMATETILIIEFVSSSIFVFALAVVVVVVVVSPISVGLGLRLRDVADRVEVEVDGRSMACSNRVLSSALLPGGKSLFKVWRETRTSLSGWVFLCAVKILKVDSSRLVWCGY